MDEKTDGQISTSSMNLDGDAVVDVRADDVGKKSGKGAVVSLAARLSNLLLTLLAQALLGRLLDPAQYGVYAMGMTALSFLLVFREFGLQVAGVQKERLSAEEASFLFWINLLIILLLGLFGVILAFPISFFYKNSDVVFVLCTMSIASIFGGVSAQHTMLLRRQLRFTTLAIIDSIALISGIVAGLIVAFIRRDVWALLAMNLVQQLVTSVATILISKWIPGNFKYRSSHLTMLRYGAGVTMANVLYYFTNNISAILIGRGLGASQLGYYNRAQQIYSIPSTVMFSSVYQVVFSSLSRLQNDDKAYRGFYLAALRRVSMFYMALSGLLIFAGDDVIAVLIGPKWAVAGQMLNIFAFALVGSAASQMTGILYQTQGRLKHFQIWGVIDSIVRIGSILIGSHWGLRGYAIGFALSTAMITAPASLWFVARRGPISLIDQLETLAPSIVIFSLSAAGAYLGQLSTRFLSPGLIPMLAELAGSLSFSAILGLILPFTRKPILEVANGMLGIFRDMKTHRMKSKPTVVQEEIR